MHAIRPMERCMAGPIDKYACSSILRQWGIFTHILFVAKWDVLLYFPISTNDSALIILRCLHLLHVGHASSGGVSAHVSLLTSLAYHKPTAGVRASVRSANDDLLKGPAKQATETARGCDGFTRLGSNYPRASRVQQVQYHICSQQMRVS